MRKTRWIATRACDHEASDRERLITLFDPMTRPSTSITTNDSIRAEIREVGETGPTIDSIDVGKFESHAPVFYAVTPVPVANETLNNLPTPCRCGIMLIAKT
jgi:hypothetical protein